MSDPFGDLGRAAAETVFAALAQRPALLYPRAGGDPLSVAVIGSQSLVSMGEFGQVIEDRDNFAFLLAECYPVSGDRLCVGSQWYRLEGPIPGGDDGIVRRLYAVEIAVPVTAADPLVTADGEALTTADGDSLKAA